MAEKKLPIGLSDYKELIQANYYYVDKTLFIKEFIDTPAKVILIPRPRRFGKTLNISMLRYFFEKTDQKKEFLFSDKKIWQYEDVKIHQGQYPVIYLTFKDIKSNDWELAYNDIAKLIQNEFDRHSRFLLPKLSEFELKQYKSILDGNANQSDIQDSLLFLSKLLFQYEDKKVIFLLDEYDTPIHTAYTNGYYDQMIKFMGTLLSKVLKDNVFLERGLLTGILYLAKAGIFSGLNNLDVYNVTDTKFEDKFGFTGDQIKEILLYYDQFKIYEDLKYWYNGYNFGNCTQLYNPWSVIQCIDKNGAFKLYWVNTSENSLIKELIAKADQTGKKEFEDILNNKPLIKTIDDSVILPDLKSFGNAIWDLLLYAGYLTYTTCDLAISGKKQCSLKIPNNEIRQLYIDLIKSIFTQSITSNQASELLKAIVTGETETLQELLQSFVINSMSTYDIPSSEPEKSYHLFILGLLVGLMDNYEIKSNRESGYGRYDIMLIPKKLNQTGVIIEFKKVSSGETLEIAAQKGLEQIEHKNYAQELKSRSVQNIVKYGIAFEGKKVLVKKA